MGQVLWGPGEHSCQKTLDRLSLSGLKQFAQRGVRPCLEEVAQGFFSGKQAGLTQGLENEKDAFYRLDELERFALACVESGSCSYFRLSKILQIGVPEVEALLWKARLRLDAWIRLQAPRSTTRSYPIGGNSSSLSCPLYEAQAPWPQRFLDQNFRSRREQSLLPHHLGFCPACQKTLAHHRAIHHFTGQAVRGTLEKIQKSPWAQGFDSAVEVIFPTPLFQEDWSFFERFTRSWIRVLSRREVWVVAGFLATVIWILARF